MQRTKAVLLWLCFTLLGCGRTDLGFDEQPEPDAGVEVLTCDENLDPLDQCPEKDCHYTTCTHGVCGFLQFSDHTSCARPVKSGECMSGVCVPFE